VTTADTTTAGTTTLAVVTAFNDAFNTRSVDAVDRLLADDCVFDGTTPPDGERHAGRAAVRDAFAGVFAGTAGGAFTTEETIVAGERAVVRWRYDWVAHDGRPGHVRGVDVFTVRHGRVAEKLAYVKG
jgi:ketosteroid isomerase-like protein